jgi:hypothetical protein
MPDAVLLGDPLTRYQLGRICRAIGYDPNRVAGIHVDPCWVIVWTRHPDNPRELLENRHPVDDLAGPT